MPQFTIPLEGGGEIRQNGATYADAVANARSAGATPAGQGGGSSGSSSQSNTGGGGGGTSSGGSAGAAGDVYQTANGRKTVDQMRQELFNAGWDGSGTIENAYARTTGGEVTYVGGATGVSSTGQPGTVINPAGTTTDDTGANLNAAQLLLNQAQQAAYQAYLNARLNLDSDQLAFTKAQGAFSNAIAAGQLTGQYNGAPTMAAQAQQAQITGYDTTGKPTFAREQAQQTTALGYLGLLSNQRGPQDYGQYLRTLGSTPGGLRDLVASAAGQYVPAAGATTNVAPQAASLGGLVNTAATGTSAGTNYADYMNTAQGLPKPNQISPDAWNRYTDTQKKILLGMYEQGGYNVQDVQDLYRQSLPKYTGLSGAGVMRLA